MEAEYSPPMLNMKNTILSANVLHSEKKTPNSPHGYGGNMLHPPRGPSMFSCPDQLIVLVYRFSTSMTSTKTNKLVWAREQPGSHSGIM